MKHKINRKASVNGLKKIWFFGKLVDVNEEESLHYHIDSEEHRYFVIKKKYLRVDKDGNGVYIDSKDLVGRLIYCNFINVISFLRKKV